MLINISLLFYYYIFSHWFGEDGEPIRLPDPLIGPSCRKLLNSSENGFLGIKYTSVSVILIVFTFLF